MPAQQRAFLCADRDGRKKVAPRVSRGELTKSDTATRRCAQDHASAIPSRQDLFFPIDGTLTAKLFEGLDHLLITREPDGLRAAGFAASCTLHQEETASASC